MEEIHGSGTGCLYGSSILHTTDITGSRVFSRRKHEYNAGKF